jgi:hypothetical protein
VEIDGLTLYGTPWNGSTGMSFGFPKAKLQEKWDMIPTGTDVLITHLPPRRILDLPVSGRHWYARSDSLSLFHLSLSFSNGVGDAKSCGNTSATSCGPSFMFLDTFTKDMVFIAIRELFSSMLQRYHGHHWKISASTFSQPTALFRAKGLCFIALL